MLKVTSLFSGIGGIDLGLEATGYFKTTLFSEIDQVCQKILKKHEKVFVGVLTPEGDVVDYTNEDNRNPEERPA